MTIFELNEFKILNYLILINIFILFVNLIFLFKIDDKIFLAFKNSDSFSLTLLNITYKEISNYLNSKLFYKNHSIKNDFNKFNKKKISIHTVDFLKGMKKCNNFYLSKILEKKFIIDFNSTNLDYLFYDIYGCEHLNPKYNRSVKIAYYSENIIPDFNQADYSLSQTHINYLDRYFKYPSFIWRLKFF